MSSCGCTTPSVATGSPCGCSAPTPQAALVSLPVVKIDCCGQTAPVFVPSCGCSVSQSSAPGGCSCTGSRIPSYPCGVSQFNTEKARNVWSY